MSADDSHKKYKGFEEDLKGDLNPTGLLEILFWHRKKWLDFSEFASLYWREYEETLRQHFPQVFASLGSETYSHLRARLYRTQFGFLTEYHAVILLASVFSPKGYTVWRGPILDRLRSRLSDRGAQDQSEIQYPHLHRLRARVVLPRAKTHREVFRPAPWSTH